MVTVNKNYLKLPGSYLFSTIAKESSCLSGSQSGCTDRTSGNRRCHTAAGTGNYRSSAQIR